MSTTEKRRAWERKKGAREGGWHLLRGAERNILHSLRVLMPVVLLLCRTKGEKNYYDLVFLSNNISTITSKVVTVVAITVTTEAPRFSLGLPYNHLDRISVWEHKDIDIFYLIKAWTQSFGTLSSIMPCHARAISSPFPVQTVRYDWPLDRASTAPNKAIWGWAKLLRVCQSFKKNKCFRCHTLSSRQVEEGAKEGGKDGWRFGRAQWEIELDR